MGHCEYLILATGTQDPAISDDDSLIDYEDEGDDDDDD